MTLRFSDQGPLFPAALIDSLLTGDVVFLCGTGISAPQLPTFRQLVDCVAEDLGIDMDPSEAEAYRQMRYEEVMGSFERRMADPAAMVRSASAKLAVPAEPQLGQHNTVLRLSRDVANRVLVVTTNFDTLLERAWRAADGTADIAAASFAGQALPSPGSAQFSGIIHLHGRLEDEPVHLEATPLVLTSADYGDAYLRSGWASRFLFDLARCKTIVLIGYSAGDAPVRYFLNVLAADRARFPDLKPVYAFAEFEGDEEAAEIPWGTVSVTPIPYCKVNPETHAHDHMSLWRDLDSLAALIERPAVTREARLRAILARPASGMDDPVLAELRWLLSGGDPWPVVIDALTDPGWFKHIQDNALWTAEQAFWVISAWVARDFSDRARFLVAVDWQNRFGAPFTQRLSALVDRAQLDPFWKRAWRAMTNGAPADDRDYLDHAYVLQQRLESGLVLDADIRRAIDRLSPVLRFERRDWYLLDESDDAPQENIEGAAPPTRIADLARITLGRDSHEDGATDLLNALTGLHDHAPRLLRAATDALTDAAIDGADLGFGSEESDQLDDALPSVEDHAQNEFHGGALLLVRVITDAFAKVVAVDRDLARRTAALWKEIPSRIGTRLMLHAMRNADAFTADEAMRALVALDDDDFWEIRRELATLLADRAAAADAALRAAVEQRIRGTADAFFNAYEIQEGQRDWRGHARDNEVWLRLSQLDGAGCLSPDGEAELAAIKARRPHLDRPLEDQDYFLSYSSGVRSVVGDTGPIQNAAPEERLDVAQEQIRSPDIDKAHGWAAYCRQDPKGAFDTLAGADLSPANLELWSALLSALAHGDEKTKPLRDDLAVEAVAVLSGLPAEALGPVRSPLVDLFYFGPRARLAAREDWYDRLWGSVCLEEPDGREISDLAEAGMNRPAGRLALILLQEHELSLAAGDEHVQRQRGRLAQLMDEPTRPGLLARATFVQRIGFLAASIEDLTRAKLVPILAGDGEGPALRAILIRHGAIRDQVTRVMPDIILKALREARPGQGEAQPAAAILLRPALAEFHQGVEGQWGFGVAEVRPLLREVASEIRRAALNLLVRWMHADERGPAEAWDLMVRPFLEQVWPKERRFVDEGNNIYLAELAIGSGAHFPAALETVRHFITPFTGRRGSVHRITSSHAPAEHPRLTLELLWLMFGPTGKTTYDMPALLDKLVAANPQIEVDRRFQSLQQRSVRA